uniref:gamma-glutamyl hydrolase-like n=1 Tax=Myxine glutinosa TaxID=7769 RepID=UPI00358EFD09
MSGSEVPHDRRPVIGVLEQVVNDDELKQFGKTCIAAAYVKYLEAAGGRVIPIRHGLAEEDYHEIFNCINGVLLPGGRFNLKTSEYARTASILYHLALQANEAGDPFPLWGICLGFQMLTHLTAGENLLVKTASTNNISLPLTCTPGIKNGRTFEKCHSDEMETWAETPVTGHHHMYSIPLDAFQSNEKLSNFYRILSTNRDHDGLDFVSTIEAVSVPFYGVQWHPEVNAFGYKRDLAAPSSPAAVRLAFHTAEFFIGQARRSSHRFASEDEEEENSIHQYRLVHVGQKTHSGQIYIIS